MPKPNAVSPAERQLDHPIDELTDAAHWTCIVLDTMSGAIPSEGQIEILEHTQKLLMTPVAGPPAPICSPSAEDPHTTDMGKGGWQRDAAMRELGFAYSRLSVAWDSGAGVRERLMRALASFDPMELLSGHEPARINERLFAPCWLRLLLRLVSKLSVVVDGALSAARATRERDPRHLGYRLDFSAIRGAWDALGWDSHRETIADRLEAELRTLRGQYAELHPGTYIYVRTYMGIAPPFPHFDALHGLPDAEIVPKLLALAREWLSENRAKLLARLRRERMAYQSRQFTTKPGPQPSTATRSHDRARYWRTLCGPRTDAGRVSRIFRLAGWGNFDPDALGRATGSRRFWLARVADRQTAQTIVEAVTDRLGRLPLSDAVGNYWTIWNCRLGIVDAARLTAKDRAVAGAEIRRMEAGENAGDAEAIRLHLLPAVRELVGDALKELPREPYPSAGRETDDAGDGIRDTTIAAGGTSTPRDLIPLTWLRTVAPEAKVGGDASKLAAWLRRRNVPVYKVARKNYCERSDLLREFKAGSNVHRLIEEYTGDGK